MGKKFRIYIIFHVIVVFLLYLSNNMLDVTEYEIRSEKIPLGFDGYKIVQVSDLHNKNFKGKLINKIENESPDIIVITGDILYKRKNDASNSEEFIKNAVKIAPVYFVLGNHECKGDGQTAKLNFLKDNGVKILKNESVEIKKGEDSIFLFGINDPTYNCDLRKYRKSAFGEIVDDTLSALNIDRSKYNILLSHRPEYFDIYSKYGFDLIFCGHAHGGLIRIPFLGGLLGPGMKLFPKYTAGKHEIGGCCEIVSRGLGGSIINIRVLNNPELVVCRLNSLK